jgi:hypothetical protein
MLEVRPTQFHHWSVLALGVWTLFSWVNRLRNIADAGESAWWYVPAVLFIAGGVLCIVAYWWGREAYVAPLRTFATLGSAYWLVRTVMVWFGDWSGAFKVVHTILALGFVGLAGAVLSRLRRVAVVPSGAFL